MSVSGAQAGLGLDGTHIVGALRVFGVTRQVVLEKPVHLINFDSVPCGGVSIQRCCASPVPKPSPNPPLAPGHEGLWVGSEETSIIYSSTPSPQLTLTLSGCHFDILGLASLGLGRTGFLFCFRDTLWPLSSWLGLAPPPPKLGPLSPSYEPPAWQAESL